MAARGFDGLVDALLEEIALCGSTGATSADFKKFVQNYYTREDGPEDAIFGGSSSLPPQVVDAPFLEYVWKWFRVHPDVLIGDNIQIKDLSFAQFQELEAAGSAAQNDDVAAAEAPEKGKGKAKAVKKAAAKPMRLFVTEERMWHAIAGHGPDLRRIQPLEWVLLSLIAAQGEKGILQPELIRLSGQDKRSVPKRTDGLHEKGYIIKQSVSVTKMRTSLCTLRKFKTNDVADIQVKGNMSSTAENKPIFADGRLIQDNLFDYLAEALTKKPIIIVEELKEDLGVGWNDGNPNRWARRTIGRAITRLCAIGVIKKVRVKAREKEHIATVRRKLKGPGPHYLRCIKALRPLTERDRYAMVHAAVAVGKVTPGYEKEDAGEDGDDIGSDMDAEGEEVEEEQRLELDVKDGNLEAAVLEDADDEVEDVRRLPPQWQPDIAVQNFLFQFIDSHGEEGVSSMALRNCGLGKHWARPLDNLLGRLTDVWEISQPPHLRHLAIIRDTSISPHIKYVHYVYRTFRHFQKAVDSGVTSWEAIKHYESNQKSKPKHTPAFQSVPKPQKSKKKKEQELADNLELDPFGLPKLDTDRFEGDGNLTLRECRRIVDRKTSTLNSYRRMSEDVINGLVGMHTDDGLDIYTLLENAMTGNYFAARKRRAENTGSGASTPIYSSAPNTPSKSATPYTPGNAPLPVTPLLLRDLHIGRPKGSKRRYPPGQTPTEIRQREKREAHLKKREEARRRKEEREREKEEKKRKKEEEKAEKKRRQDEENATRKRKAEEATVEDILADGGEAFEERGAAKKRKTGEASYAESEVGEDIPMSVPTEDEPAHEAPKSYLSSTRAPEIPSAPPSNGEPTQESFPSLTSTNHGTPVPLPAATAIDTQTSTEPASHQAIASQSSEPARAASSPAVTMQLGPPNLQEATYTSPYGGPQQIASGLVPQVPAYVPGLSTPRHGSLTPQHYVPEANLAVESQQSVQTTRGITSDAPVPSEESHPNSLSSSLDLPLGNTQSIGNVSAAHNDVAGPPVPAMQDIPTHSGSSRGILHKQPSMSTSDRKLILDQPDASMTTSQQAPHSEDPSVVPALVNSRPSRTRKATGKTPLASPAAQEPRDLSLPGVYIDPPGSAKPHNPLVRGRPRKAKIAVFKSPRLKEFEWFLPEQVPVYSRSAVMKSKKLRELIVQHQRQAIAVSDNDEDDASRTPKRDAPDSLGFMIEPDTLASVRNSARPRARSATPSESPAATRAARPPRLQETPEQRALRKVARAREKAAERAARYTGAASQRAAAYARHADLASSDSEPSEAENGRKISSSQETAAITAEQTVTEASRTESAAATEGVEERAPASEAPAAAAVEQPIPSVSTGSATAASEGVANGNGSTDEPNLVVAEEHVEKKEKKKRGVGRGGGGIMHLRTTTVMKVMENCNGVFPGDNEMSLAFTQEWNKMHRGRINAPDRHTIRNTVRHLVDYQKLRKLAFTFKDSNGLLVTKHILVLPHLTTQSPEVKECQRRMINALSQDANAKPYYPRGYGPVVPAYRPPGSDFEIQDSVEVERVYKSALELNIEKRVEAARRKREERKKNETAEKKAERKRKDAERAAARYAAKRLDAGSGLRLQRLAPLRPAKPLTSAPRTTEDSSDSVGDEDTTNELEQVSSQARAAGLEEDEEYDSEEEEVHGPLEAPAGLASYLNTLDLSKAGTVLPKFTPARERAPRRPKIQPVGEDAAVPPSGDLVQAEDEVEEAFQAEPGEMWLFPVRNGPAALNGRARDEATDAEQRKFVNYNPATYDTAYEWQVWGSLMQPGVQFYPNIGVFSTDFAYVRNARLELWVTSDPQQSWEDVMPKTVQEITRLKFIRGKERNHNSWADPAYSKFEYDLVKWMQWEKVSADLLCIGRVLRQPVFLNFVGSGEHVVAPEARLEPLWDAPQSRLYTLDAPPTADQQLLEEIDNDFLPRKVTRKQTGRRTDQEKNEERSRKRQMRQKARAGTETSKRANAAGRPRLSRSVPDKGMPSMKGYFAQDPLCVITPADTRKLLYAVVVISHLAGGDARGINWQLIQHVFRDHPHFDIASFRNRVAWLRNHSSTVIDKLGEDFQKAFLEAVDRDEVPLPNYQNLESYDWAWLIKWAMENIELVGDDFLPPLPSSRAEFERKWRVEKVDNPSIQSQKDYLHKATSLGSRRAEVTSTLPFAKPLTTSDTPKIKAQLADDDELLVARTWIRANTATPAETYDGNRAHSKLARLDENLVNRALSSLVADKTIRHKNKERLMQGRNYDFADHFKSAFRHPPLDPNALEDAVHFKRHLDRLFSPAVPAHQRRHAVPIDASDGAVLATMNLLAMGWVQLVPVLPPVDNNFGHPWPRLTVWGFLEGSYQSMQMDKARLAWGLEIIPTSQYRYGSPLQRDDSDVLMRGGPVGGGEEREGVLPAPPDPSRARPDAPIPLWRDIHDALVPTLWCRLLSTTCHALATRPGVSIEQLVKLMKNMPAPWEMRLLMGWMREAGVVATTAELFGTVTGTVTGTAAGEDRFHLRPGWWGVLWDWVPWDERRTGRVVMDRGSAGLEELRAKAAAAGPVAGAEIAG